MAEGIALHRFAETMLPEDVRILSDQYAVHFLDPVKMAWAMEHPRETREMAEEIERKMPGLANAIRARIRYFDDIVQDASGGGFSQLVILGAGYDTRVFRIDSLKGGMKTFEIDRHDTQIRKTGIITKVFGELPDNLTFIALDMAQNECWNPLFKAGWSPREKTVFLLEGLVMYLPRPAVDDLLTGIACHAGVGSAVLFDFMPQSLADGSSDIEGGQNIRQWTIQIGEPIVSGFADGEIKPFLTGIGYSEVSVITSRELGKRYFTGKNANRRVSGLISVAHATVAGGIPQ